MGHFEREVNVRCTAFLPVHPTWAKAEIPPSSIPTSTVSAQQV